MPGASQRVPSSMEPSACCSPWVHTLMDSLMYRCSPSKHAVPLGLPVLSADGAGRDRYIWDGDGMRHFVSSPQSCPPPTLIARVLRGYSEGPVKTGPELQLSWCAILGLNQ